jgi:hypothetical protein
MYRGWTYIDEDTEHDESLTPLLDHLASEWSALRTEMEQEGWRRQADAEDDNEPLFDSDEEYEEYKSQLRIADLIRSTRLEVLEEMLAKHGARMMRPYEHWNEDEAYMEYQERDR